MSQVVREPRINGIMLQNRLQNIGMVAGRSVLEQVREGLPPDLSEAYRYGRIVAGGWYPISWLRALHASLERVAGANANLARKLGYFGTKQNFRGVHRAFLRVLSPTSVIERSSRIFRTYYEVGDMTATRVDSNMAIARWTECLGFDANLWEATFGSCEAALEMCRGQSIHLQVTAGGRDRDESAEIVVTWL